MNCSSGTELLIGFQEAAICRASARDNLLLSSQNMIECEVLLLASKVRYYEALRIWISHRGICDECRQVSIGEDRKQFASV